MLRPTLGLRRAPAPRADRSHADMFASVASPALGIVAAGKEAGRTIAASRGVPRSGASSRPAASEVGALFPPRRARGGAVGLSERAARVVRTAATEGEDPDAKRREATRSAARTASKPRSDAPRAPASFFRPGTDVSEFIFSSFASATTGHHRNPQPSGYEREPTPELLFKTRREVRFDGAGTGAAGARQPPPAMIRRRRVPDRSHAAGSLAPR